jgi:hypothetical protein
MPPVFHIGIVQIFQRSRSRGTTKSGVGGRPDVDGSFYTDLGFSYDWGVIVSDSVCFDGGFIGEFVNYDFTGYGFIECGFTSGAALRLQRRRRCHRVPLGTPGECVGQRAMP